jgi:hypothetical protein
MTLIWENMLLFCSYDVQNQHDLGMMVIKRQLTLYPYLKVRQSSLGKDVGMGLFASRDIDLSPGDQPFMLCSFFGRVLFLNEMDLSDQHWNDDIFEGGFQNTQIELGFFFFFLM